MKLHEAKLCLDCEELFSSPGRCPACGSPVYAPLAYWVKPIAEAGSIDPERLARGDQGQAG